MSQTARGSFDAGAYATDGEGCDGAVAGTGETAGSTPTQTEPEDLVADLVDDLLDEGEDDEDGTEVT